MGRVAYKGVADVPRAPLKGFTESEMSLIEAKGPKIGNSGKDHLPPHFESASENFGVDSYDGR